MSDTTPPSPTASGTAMPAELNPRHLLRRLLVLAGLIAVVAVGIGSLPGFGTLRSRFAQADGWLLIVIGLLKLGSCLSNVVAFRDVFCPSMSWGFSYELGMAEQGTNVLLPTGGAGGWPWGHGRCDRRGWPPATSRAGASPSSS